MGPFLDIKYTEDSHRMHIEPLTRQEVQQHFPDLCEKYKDALEDFEPEHDRHPESVISDITCDVNRITRKQWHLVTHANAKQTDEMIRYGSVHGLEHLDKSGRARSKDPLGMIPEDDDEGGMAGRMRPPQHKQHRKNESRYMYRSGEHLSLDPIGPFQIASPQGFDCAMVYGDKHDGDISVQGFKLAGKRSVTSLVKEEINFRELRCEKFKGIKLDLHMITSDHEAKLISDEMETMCAEDKLTHFKSPPRSHKFNFIENRIKTLKAKALSLYHASGFPLTLYLHALICAAFVINMLTTKGRQSEDQRYKTPYERQNGHAPHVTDCYPHGSKVYVYATIQERDQHAKHNRIAYYLHPTRLTPTSHDLYDPSTGEIVSRSDELISVIYEVTYGMEMGKAFEDRLRMQRYARKLQEESVRTLQKKFEERDLLHRIMQQSLSNKLMLDSQVEKGMVPSEGVYHRAMERAIDTGLEAQMEHMKQQEKRKRTESAQGSATDDSKQQQEPRRRGHRERKQTHDPNRVWLESWNDKVKVDLPAPPTNDLLMEAIETMLMKTDVECGDLLDRIGNEFDMDTKLMQLQAEHWHDRGEDDYGSLKEAVERHGGEGDAIMEALIDEVDFMYGKNDGKVRVKVHNVNDLLRDGKIKSRRDVLKKPRGIIKKKMKPNPSDRAKQIFDRMRVRLTAPGHLSKAFVHFNPNMTRAPVMAPCTLILIFILTVLYDLDLFQTDDSKAFYFGESDFEYFVWLPDIICDMLDYAPHGADTVWEPLTSWYGTKCAAQEYYTATVNHVTDPNGMGMMKSDRDPAFFVKWFDPSKLIFFGMHVDDKIGSTTSLDTLFTRWFVPKMNEKFITTAEEEVSFALGANIDWNKETGVLTLSSETAITKFLSDNHLTDINPRSTACSQDLIKRIEAAEMPSTDEEKAESARIRPAYWKYLGWAAHIARFTVPWAITACGIAAKFMANPGKVHFELVMYIIAHLAYVVKKKIWRRFKRPKDFNTKNGALYLCFMVDSDHRGNKSGTSNSGLAVFICGMFLCGSRKPQKCITMNTCESEFISMAGGSQFAIWLLLLLQEARFRIDYPAALLGDNTAAIATAFSHSTKYARHIDLKAKFVCRVAKMKDIVIAYINTHSNVSDAFTKIVDPKSFARFMNWMANGLDDSFDKEIVTTLETLFQECRMRDMATSMKEKRKQQRLLDEARTSGGVTSQSDRDVTIPTSTKGPRAGTKVKTTSISGNASSNTINKIRVKRRKRYR